MNLKDSLLNTPEERSLSWDHEELGRKIVFLNILHAVSIPYFIFFAIVTFLEEQYLLSGIDSAVCLFLIADTIINHVFKRPVLSIHLTVLPLSTYILYLYFYSIDTTAWTMTVPVAAYFLMGSMSAGILICIYMIFISANIIHPFFDHTDYNEAFELRFLAAFFMIAISSHVLNILRKKAYYSLKQRSQALDDSEQRYRNIFDSTPAGLIILSLDGRLVEANPAMSIIFGYTREEIFKGAASRFFSDDLLNSLNKTVYSVNQQGFFIHDAVEKHKNGNQIHIRIRVSPFKNKEENHLLIMIQDITAQVKAEKENALIVEKLHWSEKMQAIGQLAGGVAHDLNNSLATILGYTEILSEKTDRKSSNVKYLGRIIESVNRSAGVTAKLLAFARRGKFHNTAIDIHEIVNDIAALLQHAVDKRIEIKREFFASHFTVSGDPSQIQGAIMNISINASDAMPDGGTIRFRTHNIVFGSSDAQSKEEQLTPGPYIRIDIIDNGKGMDENTQKRLFEPFFTTKKLGEGLGMGLPAAYGAITNHKGTIKVKSEIGKGTSFSLFLPLSMDIQASKDADSEEDADYSGIPGARILVVDDEEPLREMAREILEECGYKINTCANGAEAVEFYRLKWRETDLILLDLVMPVKGGADAFREMKQINPSGKILLSSGFTVDREASELLAEGALDFLQKPYTFSALARAVAKSLR